MTLKIYLIDSNYQLYADDTVIYCSNTNYETSIDLKLGFLD